MLDREDIWEDSFNNPNLENENWLEPSDDLFGKIEEELARTEDKKKPLYWLWLLAFILIGLGIMVWSNYIKSPNYGVVENKELLYNSLTTSIPMRILFQFQIKLIAVENEISENQ